MSSADRSAAGLVLGNVLERSLAIFAAAPSTVSSQKSLAAVVRCEAMFHREQRLLPSVSTPVCWRRPPCEIHRSQAVDTPVAPPTLAVRAEPPAALLERSVIDLAE